MTLSWTDVLEQWGDARGAAEALSDDMRTTAMKDMHRLSLFRPKVQIAMTGLRGAGKSVLYDALAGATGPPYRPPGRSLDREEHKIVLATTRARTRSSLLVIPGQAAGPRRLAEDLAFGPGCTTTGVIHVVCWGRNEIWGAGGQDVILDQLRASGEEINLSTIVELGKKQELENFRRICMRLKDAWADRKNVWLIIAVSKCDLFWKDLAEARDYYIPTSAELHARATETTLERARAATAADPGSADLRHAVAEAETALRAATDPARSEFARELQDLVQKLGWDTFRNVAVLPVSSHLDTYRFGGEVAEKESNLSESMKNTLSSHFLAKVGEFCGL